MPSGSECAVRHGVRLPRGVRRPVRCAVRCAVLRGRGYPISSRVLPLVSFTKISTKGMESTAKQV